MPLYRRLPKSGFKNINRVEYVGINLDTLTELSERTQIKDITIDVLRQHGLLSSGKDRVKILGRGELGTTINVTAHSFSKTAKAAIESKGGVASII